MTHSRLVSSALAIALLTSVISTAEADSAAEREAEEYMQTWEERGREACKDNERGCAAAGHALDRAAAAYEKAGKLDKAIAIRKMILDPQWHLDYTDYGRTAAFTLAQNYQAIVEYAEAAQIIEIAVRRFAKSDEAPAALEEAITLRLGLGELERAQDDLASYSKNYGSKRAKELPALANSVALGFERAGRQKDIPAFFEKWMATIDRHGNVHDKIMAHALLGRVYAQEGAKPKAMAEFEVVRASWNRPEEAVKEIQKLWPTQPEQDRHLAQAITGVGEALFFFAEQKRAEVVAMRFPDYTGAGDRESVLRFVNTKAAEWLKKKKQAIEETDLEYQKILHVQPVPPPRWVIAAAGRVGFMWSSLVTDFQRTPTPKEWNANTLVPGSTMTYGELKKLYLERLSSLSEPLNERAKQAFKVCVNYSRKFQWFDDHAQACWTWLEKHDPKTWVPFDELHPRPAHSAVPVVSTLIAVP